MIPAAQWQLIQVARAGVRQPFFIITVAGLPLLQQRLLTRDHNKQNQ
jgi:hypothetical protein